jgi:hypothetical protein
MFTRWRKEITDYADVQFRDVNIRAALREYQHYYLDWRQSNKCVCNGALQSEVNTFIHSSAHVGHDRCNVQNETY